MKILLFYALSAIYFASQDGYSTPPRPLRNDTERLLLSAQAPRILRSPVPLAPRSPDDIVQAHHSYFGYVKKRPVGQGCSASVWRAENGHGNIIAVKKFKVEFANSTMVQKEIDILREATEEEVSNYLVKAFETIAGTGWMMDGEIGMEFLEGKNLKEIFSWIEEDEVWESKLWVMGHVLFAVSEMVDREYPFVHNDLHWGNVMIVLRNGVLEVKIVDLGQARFVDMEDFEMCEYKEREKIWYLGRGFDEDRLDRGEPGHWMRQLDIIPMDVDKLAFSLFLDSPSPEVLRQARDKAEAGLSLAEDRFLKKRLKETSAFEKKNMWKIDD